MNTSDNAPQFEVSFIHDDRRVQARGPLTDQQREDIHMLLRVGRRGPQDVSALPVMPGQGSRWAGSAEELVETITNAIETDEEADGADWDKVRELARRIDAGATDCANPKTLLVEFIWNNSGGDDNQFGQGFAADGAGPDNEALIDEFTQALERAGQDAFYDLGVQVEDAATYMSMQELVEWIEQNHSEDEQLLALSEVLAPTPVLAPRAAGMR